MKEQTAVVIGATGLIGNHLINELLNDDDFTIIRILVRKPIAIQNPKLQQEVVDFNDENNFSEKVGSGDAIFCCVGTTIKKVKGDLKEYEKVDLHIPVNAAKIGVTNNFSKYLVISSAGANAKSKNFYLRIKGQMENAVKQFPYNRISIFRPGQLLGNRNEYRRGEKIIQRATTFLSLFLFGNLKKYHSVKALDVAKAMIEESKIEEKGIFILEYPEIKQLIHTHN